MSRPEGNAIAKSIRDDTISPGAFLLVRLPNADVRCVKIDKNTAVSLGKFGTFPADDLLDHPYGLTYEITDKKLQPTQTPTLEEVAETDATNELINDGQFVQPLTLDEIEALKQSGVHATEIIKRQIEQHANYSLKTEYSKDKYKKRKEAKFSKSFTTVEPTLFSVCEFWFQKDRSRIRDLRVDTLSQMMNMGNVRPGGRYLAVDDASGLLIAAVLDRMGGEGRLLSICDVESPPAYPILSYMNFKKDVLASTLVSLNWATIEESYIPTHLEIAAEEIRSERQMARVHKRQEARNILASTREELFAGEFDGLLMTSDYEPYSVIEKLSPYLGGSASIVVHSPHVQPVASLHSILRSNPSYLGPSLTEAWLRRYQVLPGRTHPLMNTSGSGGVLLHAIKVYDDPAASSFVAKRVGVGSFTQHNKAQGPKDGDDKEDDV